MWAIRANKFGRHSFVNNGNNDITLFNDIITYMNFSDLLKRHFIHIWFVSDRETMMTSVSLAS